MPTISYFLGIRIYMYFDDHNPPHFHAVYQDFEAEFLLDGTLLRGSLPPKQQKQVEVWADLHQTELVQNWAIAQGGTPVPLNRIPPLQ